MQDVEYQRHYLPCFPPTLRAIDDAKVEIISYPRKFIFQLLSYQRFALFCITFFSLHFPPFAFHFHASAFLLARTPLHQRMPTIAQLLMPLGDTALEAIGATFIIPQDAKTTT
ncbi:MAG: hypothetical protein IJU19_05315 [Bacteroidales bacterium]|nr:hypothetical protein [Bacteroidales bacterium]